MLAVAIYIQDTYTSEYNRVDLFDDEKISVTSSIQQINDISKTFTDYSQTFTVPATKQNNKIFRHWYDNSNEQTFSVLTKSNAFIEIDTITFRKGKIQLESANVVDGHPQDYSITFVGLLGNLKDKFAGLYLTDLNKTTAYDFIYTPTFVKDRVTQPLPIENVMFPLISSNRNWKYGSGDNIANISTPIYHNELFPALRLGAVFGMIQDEFDIDFSGYYQTDDRFYNSYLWLKNSDTFDFKPTPVQITWTQGSSIQTVPYVARQDYKTLEVTISPTVANIQYSILMYKNGVEFARITKTSIVGLQSFVFGALKNDNSNFTIYIVSDANITFNSTAIIRTYSYSGVLQTTVTWTKASNQVVTISKLSVKSLFPEIKIIDFFTGVLKMFNLTCFTSDGVNYTVMPLEEYYASGSDVDLTKYVIADKKNINRVKTYKKINFDYEKSESLTNVLFNSNSGIEYGSLSYSTNNDGEEYSVKIPFENLNFQNLGGLFQVGYVLKTDLKPYIPKPIILYAYSQGGTLTVPQYYFSTSTSGNGLPYTTYHAFGQETLISGETYSLNFNEQQSTLTNALITNGLYDTYYGEYFNNIFNYKARLIKVSAILPTSILTSLKLNDNIIIRDAKYLINTMNTDLTTGEVQFELLTDQRL